ncbi:MAG TPA: SLBB domain-containing protein, partial [Candidatus Dormibacteraeota bacterium]|nr:SLBB domain-containing protein [Candidatus Dormibacteraeota bacterium]
MIAAAGRPVIFEGSPGLELLADHRERLGALPPPAQRSDLIGMLEASGLKGRGGAGFPVGRKWRSVAERGGGRAVLLVNGAEGEPLSLKDRSVMAMRPHLVVDGALLAADAVGLEEVIFYVGAEHHAARASMSRALAERRADFGRRRMRLLEAPTAYVAGEESAAVNFVQSGVARPTTTPPRPFERGVRGRPTLVQNIESLSMAALIAQYGERWYRGLGRGTARGLGLVTVSGAVSRPGLQEVELGSTVGEVVETAGGARNGLQAVLLGGYFGAFAPADEAWDLELDQASMRARGYALGCGVVSLLSEAECGVKTSSRIMGYMAAQSARQCGPCVFGLAAIAEATSRLSARRAHPGDLQR